MKQKLSREQLAVYSAYWQLFFGPQGDIVMRDLENAHHFNSTTLKGSPLDPLDMARCEGERNVILRIKTILEMRQNYDPINGAG